MTFRIRNDKQRGQIAQTLCLRAFPEAKLWVEDELGVPRPTDYAVKIAKGKTGAATSEIALARAAWDVWNDSSINKHLTLPEILYNFDATNTRCIAELLLAMATSAEAVDAWILAWSLNRSRN